MAYEIWALLVRACLFPIVLPVRLYEKISKLDAELERLYNITFHQDN